MHKLTSNKKFINDTDNKEIIIKITWQKYKIML
jgi:hypothetical protein